MHRCRWAPKALALVAVVLMASGCRTRLTDFTFLSTKNVDLSRIGEFQRAPQRIEGKDTIHIILFVPTGQPNLKEAIDRAIESVPGGVCMVDGVVYTENWYIPLIYGQTSTVCEGSVLFDPQFSGNSILKSP